MGRRRDEDVSYSKIACDFRMACAVRTDRGVDCWGFDVGLSPVRVPELDDVIDIAVADFGKVFAIQSSGKLLLASLPRGEWK